jgi:DNA-binding LacI/PurR family transcriptional regulator
MATIKKIADLANVSPATISRFLNGKINVSQDTKRRIEKAVDELNYQPNYLARSLILNQTKTLGIIIPDILDPFHAGIARGFEDEALKNDYNVILCNSDNEPKKEIDYLDWLSYKRADGIAIVSTGLNADTIKKHNEKGMKMVLIGRVIEGLNADTLTIDNLNGAYTATKHLLDLGHRDIALINVQKKITPSVGRMKGYKKAVEDYGQRVNVNLLASAADFRYLDGYKAMKKLLDRKENFTSVFAMNDQLAIGAINAIRDAGFRVPDNYSVVGFDGLPWGTWIRPRLTTISVSPYKYGVKSCDLLLNQFKNDKKVVKYSKSPIKGKLIERDSCCDFSNTEAVVF